METVLLGVDVPRILYCMDVVLTTYESLRTAVRGGADVVLQGGEEEGSDETLPDPASLRAETRGLFAVPWERVIADEATYMKNPASLNFAVVKMLKAIEQKVDSLVKAFGGEFGDAAAAAPREVLTDEDLLNGPQLPTIASDQDEIDRLLASFD